MAKKTYKKISLKNRMTVLLIAFCLMIVLVLIRMFYLQVIASEKYEKKAFDQSIRSSDVETQRGVIYDRNRKPFAVNTLSKKISIDPRLIRKSGGEDLTEKAMKLAEILDLDSNTIFSKFMKEESANEDIIRKVSKEIGDEVVAWAKSSKLDGVYVTDDVKRYYPNGSLAAHIVGHTGIDNQGLRGIEASMDDYLTGEQGRILRQADASDIDLPFEEFENNAVMGNDVVLTIDETIQRFADTALDKAIVTNDIKNGAAALVMNTNTGEIYAMVTKPDVNPNDYFTKPITITDEIWKGLDNEGKSAEVEKVWKNRIINGTYEPGSTFKAMTTIMALEEGVRTPDTPVDDSPVQVEKWVINCWSNPLHGYGSFTRGVQCSCNPVFVRAALDIGKDKFYSYMRDYGFYDKTGINLPSEIDIVEGQHIHKDPNIVDLASASFGQRFQITPMQLAIAYCAIANGGKLLKPQIIKEVVDKNGNVIKKYEPEVIRKIASEETLATVRTILESVVSEGTGKNAYIMGYRVAGKSGTSETLVKDKYIASFSAFAPADNPEICVLVICDDPNGPYGHQGGAVAAPVVKEIMEQTLTYLSIKPRYSDSEKEQAGQEVGVPNIIGKPLHEARTILDEQGLNFEIGDEAGEDVIINKQIPEVGTTVIKGSYVIGYVNVESEKEMVTMPYLIDMSAQEATIELSKKGLLISRRGNGIAVGQSVEASTPVEKGTIIEVEFRHQDGIE